MGSLELPGKARPQGTKYPNGIKMLMCPISIWTFFSRFKIVLEEQADAVRAFLAIADCVEAITIAQDDLKIFIPRSER